MILCSTHTFCQSVCHLTGLKRALWFYIAQFLFDGMFYSLWLHPLPSGKSKSIAHPHSTVKWRRERERHRLRLHLKCGKMWTIQILNFRNCPGEPGIQKEQMAVRREITVEINEWGGCNFKPDSANTSHCDIISLSQVSFKFTISYQGELIVTMLFSKSTSVGHASAPLIDSTVKTANRKEALSSYC